MRCDGLAGSVVLLLYLSMLLPFPPCSLSVCLSVSCLLACDLFYLRGVGSEHVSVYLSYFPGLFPLFSYP